MQKKKKSFKKGLFVVYDNMNNIYYKYYIKIIYIIIYKICFVKC